MMKYLFVMVFLFFSGCSFKPSINQWQYKSALAFNNYKKNFLSYKDILAKDDLKKAISYAKNGADIDMLSSIYLGKCALNISIGIKDKCNEYNNIKDLVESKSQESYYAFIQKDFNNIDIENLDERYRDFAKYLSQKDYKKANEEIKNLKEPTSKLLAISLLGDKVSKQNLKEAIDLTSFYGYKKGVIYLLGRYKTKVDLKTKDKIDKKIQILLK